MFLKIYHYILFSVKNSFQALEEKYSCPNSNEYYGKLKVQRTTPSRKWQIFFVSAKVSVYTFYVSTFQ